MAKNKNTGEIVAVRVHVCVFFQRRMTACVVWTYRENNPLSQGARITLNACG